MPPEDRLRRRTALAVAAGDPGFPALKARVIARTGHHYYADKDDLLFDRLVRRFRALGLPDAAAYAAHLDGPDGPREWAVLEAEITIGETFFFRYAEQFAALRAVILPELIAGRGTERDLRIWSAGCSTGAEPYSVAILLHELLGPARADWDLGILGTDLSAAALATARAAEYGRWALRTTPPEDRVRWFRRMPPRPGPTREGGYRLRDAYRDMVRFERANLMDLVEGDAPPAPPGFDLILCRNVLIYFSPEHVLGLVRAFAARLRPGGWLLIGHAEPSPAFEAWLDPVNLAGTVAYRRRGDDGSGPRLSEPPRPASPPRTSGSPYGPGGSDPLSHLHPEAPERHGGLEAAFREALPMSPRPPAPSSEAAGAAPRDEDGRGGTEPASDRIRAGRPPPADDPLPRIRALADAGETGEAWRRLRAALAAEPTAAPLRFYEGLLARSLGRETEAERAFRGALFLDRDFVMARFHLGLLLAATGRPAEAARALDNALRLAQGLAADAVLPEGDGVTAGELAATMRLALRDLGGGPAGGLPGDLPGGLS